MPVFRTPWLRPKQPRYFVISAENAPLGRLSAKISAILQGKNSAQYNPMWIADHYVFVTDSDKVRLTGSKWEEKRYFHSLYIGGLKERKAKELTPEQVIRLSVSGMLPKNKLRKRLLKRLKIVSSLPANLKNFAKVKLEG